MQAGELGVGQRHLADHRTVAVDEIDHARRHPGRLQQLHRQLRREGLLLRGLPHHGVAHQRRRGGQVAGDRGEVERRQCEDEALQRPVIHAVPGAR